MSRVRRMHGFMDGENKGDSSTDNNIRGRTPGGGQPGEPVGEQAALQAQQRLRPLPLRGARRRQQRPLLHAVSAHKEHSCMQSWVGACTRQNCLAGRNLISLACTGQQVHKTAAPLAQQWQRLAYDVSCVVSVELCVCDM